MENVIAILTENFKAETIISAVVVCLATWIIRKIKPNLPPKVELAVRLLLSVIIHLVFTLISKGNLAQVAQGGINVCGVSMLLCATFSGGKKEEVKVIMENLLPDLEEEKVAEILSEVDKIPPSADYEVGNCEIVITSNEVDEKTSSAI